MCIRDRLDRVQALQLVQANADNSRSLAEYNADRKSSEAVGGLVTDILKPFANAGVSSLIDSVFGSSGGGGFGWP